MRVFGVFGLVRCLSLLARRKVYNELRKGVCVTGSLWFLHGTEDTEYFGVKQEGGCARARETETLPTREQKAVDRFINEAQAASSLDHANICTIYEINETDESQLYIAMAYYAGETLEKKVATGQLTVDSAIDIAMQVASGLERAHEAGIIHRDIKPSNLIITPRGEVKIIDWGVAKLSGTSRLTKTGRMFGTVAYMSPEQIQLFDMDHRTDIWSLGVVLYEMLTGKLPFRGDNEAAIVYSIVNEKPEALAKHRTEVPKGVQQVLDKALIKDVERRYQHIQSLLDDLKLVAQGVSELITAPPRPRKRLLSYGLSGAFVLSVVLLLSYIFTESPPESRTRIPIAVVDVLNETDEAELNGLSGMLITALEQSSRLSVLTRSRMFDILKQMGKADVARIDEVLGKAICDQAHVKTMAIASVKKFGKLYTIDLKILDSENDRYIFTTSEKGQGQEGIPDMIDRLAERTRNALLEKQTEIKAAPIKVASLTTPDLQAYYHFFKGEEFINSSYYLSAIDEFNKAIAIDSTFGLAYYRLAYAIFWVDANVQYIDADGRKALEKAYALIDRFPEKEKYLLRALKAGTEQRVEATLTILKEMEKVYPDDKEMLLSFGDFYMTTFQTDKAIPYLEKVWAMDSTQARTIYNLASAYGTQNQNSRAERIIKRGLTLYPTNTGLLYQLGMTLYRQERYQEAEEVFRREFELEPDYAGAANNLGMIFRVQKKYTEAEAFFRKAYQAHPNNLGLLSNLGLSLLDQQKYVEAERIFKKCLEIEPTNTELISRLGTALFDQQKYLEAEKFFREAYRANSSNLYAVITLGWNLFNQHQRAKFIQAETVFRWALELEPKNPDVINGLGWSLINQGKLDEANKILKRGYELAPKHVAILNGLGYIAFTKKDYDLAKQYWEGCLQFSGYWHFSAQLAMIALLQKRYGDAEEKYLAALAFDSTATTILTGLAYVNLEQRKFTEAHQFALQALVKDSSFKNYNLMARILVLSEMDIDKGIDLAEKALALKPEDYKHSADLFPYLAVPEHTLGIAYLKKGQPETAVQYLEQATAFVPDREGIKLDLEQARQKLQIK